jgi:hypothetical protein
MKFKLSVLSLVLALLVALTSPATLVVQAGPDSTGPSSATVPLDWGTQTLRTLQERLFPASKGAPVDAHPDASPAPAPAATPAPTPELGAVYVDLVQRVAVRHPIPLAQRRGKVNSRSGQGFVIVHERRVVPVDISPIILKYAQKHHVDPFLIKAVMFTESHFRNSATSWCGAQGLMQLMPGTGRMMGARDLYDPDQNIAAGTRYLRMMLDRYSGNLRAAIAAYNAGPGNVPLSGAIPNITETRNYVHKVMKAYKSYKDEAEKATAAAR